MQEYGKDFIERLRRQDGIAQKQVFESLYSTLFRLCMRYLANQADAEDCLMTGYVKVFKQIDRFVWQHEQSFVHWCKRIVVNEALMHLRGRQTFMSIVGDEENDQGLNAEVFDKIHAEELYSCMLELPVGYRTVLNLFAIEGYSHKEIAEMLKISESTSKTQFQKAKLKLKTIIDKKQSHGLTKRG